MDADKMQLALNYSDQYSCGNNLGNMSDGVVCLDIKFPF